MYKNLKKWMLARHEENLRYNCTQCECPRERDFSSAQKETTVKHTPSVVYIYTNIINILFQSINITNGTKRTYSTCMER